MHAQTQAAIQLSLKQITQDTLWWARTKYTFSCFNNESSCALNEAFSMENTCSEAAEQGFTNKALEAAAAQLTYYS